MAWFRSSLGHRILILLAMAAMVTGAVGAVGYFTLRQVDRLADLANENALRAMYIERINGEVYSVVMDSRGVYMGKSTADAAKFAKPLFATLDRMRTTLEELKAVGMPEFAEFEAKCKSFIALRTELARLGAEVSPEAADKFGNNDENRANRQRLNQMLDSLVATNQRNLKIVNDDLDAAVTNGKLIFLSAAAIAGLGLLIFGYSFVRAFLGTPLRKAVGALRDITNGVENTEIPGLNRADELGEIARALQAFETNRSELRQAERARDKQSRDTQRRAQDLQSLREAISRVVDCAIEGDFSARMGVNFSEADLHELAGALDKLMLNVEVSLKESTGVLDELRGGKLDARVHGEFKGAFEALKLGTNAMAGRLQTALEQISVTAGGVRSATREIATGIDDLAQRTADQASTAAETSTSLAGFADLANRNAASANDAASAAHTAEEQARDGAAVLTDTLGAMQRIDSSSKRISDITELMDGIAFQTNLLALNAAVEAARAGDAGKGFAVVASEVRSLAQRATNASQEIKALVTAAQAEVASGVALVDRTSTRIEATVAAISDVTKLVSGIAQASNEQAKAIHGLANAVESMGDMAQQNAALVEETHAAISLTEHQTAQLEAHASNFSAEKQDGSAKALRAA